VKRRAAISIAHRAGRVSRAGSLSAIAFLFSVCPAQRAAAQSVRVYTEFRRLGPDGAVIEADQGGRPREILSPALPRNAFTSYRILVEAPPNKQFTMYVGQNPDDVVKPTLYREEHQKVGNLLLPERLRKVTLPYTSPLAETAAGRPVTFWLDIWVPPNAPVRRMRFEVQMNYGSEWFIYPMELRIESTVIPSFDKPSGGLAPQNAPAQDTALLALHQYLCGKPETKTEISETVRGFILRNASQDVALARSLEKKPGRTAVEASILPILGYGDVKAWCASRTPQNLTLGAESAERYLQIRDSLYHLAVQ